MVTGRDPAATFGGELLGPLGMSSAGNWPLLTARRTDTDFLALNQTATKETVGNEEWKVQQETKQAKCHLQGPPSPTAESGLLLREMGI